MPIEGVIQPVEIKVDERIRLRKYDYNIGSRKCFEINNKCCLFNKQHLYSFLYILIHQ